ncbi:hypothetical protein K6119_10190 [Paracrocinitomix mangrovi]|uniref:hypothetical protein n=1 Tax=Paracrocinitomix mangrovi TaxID=2862509 RepID=UPI001C8EC877|nr:hypothetical protein [Paracrocinitomix mangrovi]UKN00102.1 hypothetical protein K6119_10190 [Paracrocinitomix mangrovi]
MAIQYKQSDIIKGGIIYALGDTIAALISQDFEWIRFVGILVIGATIYALEIPNYFKWIDKKVASDGSISSSFKRAGLAMLYFNPLWIARHILFIQLLTGKYDQIGWGILIAGSLSFVFNIPLSLAANYLIQNKVSLKNRFLASAIFSGLMAIYYSLSAIWF